MPQKKETSRTTQKKPGVKVQDLAPKKDAKGGGGKGTQGSNLSGGGKLSGSSLSGGGSTSTSSSLA